MEWDTRSIVYITFEAITGVVTIIGNVVVLVAIVKTRRLHTVTNVFIANLAIADIFVGVFVAPLAALSFLGLPPNVYGCIFINSAILMFTNVSILMLLGVAVERFVAIRLPFMYNRLLTTRRALWFNGLIWTLGIVLGLIPMYGWNIAPDSITRCAFEGVISMEYMIYFQFFGLVLLPIVIMLFIYTYILCVIRKHAKRTDALHNMFNRDNRSRRQWKKEVLAAKSFALLIVLFAVFWIPVYIMNCLTLFCPTCYKPLDLLLAAIVMSHANSSINPFLYAASNSRIQKSILSIFCRRQTMDETSVDMQSGKDHHNVRGSNVPPLNRGISIIGDNKIEDCQNDLRLASPPSLLQTTRDDGPDNKEVPALTQHLPDLPVLNGDTRIEALAAIDLSKTNSMPNPLESHKAESSTLSNGSLRQLSQDDQRFSDGHVCPPGDHKNDEVASSKYISDGILDTTQDFSDKKDVNGSPALTPIHVSGHVNFAFIDDTTISEGPPASSPIGSQYVVKGEHYNNSTDESVHTSGGIGNEKEYLQISDRGTLFSSEDPYNHTSINVSPTESVGPLKGTLTSVGFIENDKFRRDTRQYSPIASTEFFEMVDEPEEDQEYSGIVFVVEEPEMKGEQSRTNGLNSVQHSYFRTHSKTRPNNNITDVEISSKKLFINLETEQTKL